MGNVMIHELFQLKKNVYCRNFRGYQKFNLKNLLPHYPGIITINIWSLSFNHYS